MSLTKLLKAPIKLFMKEVITFVTIRRYDLGIINESLRYIAVRPSASISVLRQKVWHLLDLPDYCEEIIILKSPGNVEIALTELRNGNNLHHPYILEVWLPGKPCDSSTTFPNNMLMDKDDQTISTTVLLEKMDGLDKFAYDCTLSAQSTIATEPITLNKPRATPNNLLYADFKKSELSCRISNSSIFRLNGRKSRENFTNLLLKIQSDLSTLTNKLTVLENKISP